MYGAWSLFQGLNGNNSIQFVRSTDHGATFSHPAKISTGSKDVQFADIAVTSNGTVYVAYRQFDSSRGHQENADPVRRLHRRRAHLQQAGRRRRSSSRFDAADSAGDPDGGRGGARAGLRERRRPGVRGR